MQRAIRGESLMREEVVEFVFAKIEPGLCISIDAYAIYTTLKELSPKIFGAYQTRIAV